MKSFSKLLCFALPMFSLIPLQNNNLNSERIFDEDLKVLTTSSIRDSEDYYLKILAKIPSSFYKKENDFGFISTKLWDIVDSNDFVLSHEKVTNHQINFKEISINDDFITFASDLKIPKEDLTIDYAVRSYVKENNQIYYSQEIVTFNYYKIVEKIENANNDKISILNYASKAKEINDNGLDFVFDQNQGIYKVTGFKETALENTIIPSYYKGYPVTEISENAFINNNVIKTIQIPDTLKTIAKNAFKNASLVIYVSSKDYLEDWDVNFNPSYCPIYYDIKSRRNHKEYLTNENRIKIENYIHQLVSGGNKLFNQENYPIYKTHYSDAVMMSALLDLYEVNHDPYYLNSAINEFSQFINNNKGKISWKYTPSGGQLDSIPIGDVLLRFYSITKDESYFNLSSRTHDILVSSNRIKCEGKNFYHKNNYPNQIWLDGLYMAMPYYARYETFYNEHKNYEDIYKQYKYVYDKMRNVENGLYYHGYDESNLQSWSKENETNPKCSLSFWGRAIGWLVVSLVNVIDTLEVNNENELIYETFLEKMLKESIQSVYNFADEETNLFYQVIDQGTKAGNYLETSASSLICFATLKANRLGILDEEYYLKGLKTFNSILEQKLIYDEINNKYTLKDINLVAGLGDTRNGTYEYYISEQVVNDNAKGSGPLLMSYSELLY